MREVLFRGKKMTGEWVHGHYNVHHGRHGIMTQEHDFYNPQVIPETVSQFTGLLDKNGLKIFEGDIYTHNNKKFVCNWSERFGYCFVEVNKALGKFHLDGILKVNHNNRKQADIICFLHYIEVIGNIHDNPELLQ